MRGGSELSEMPCRVFAGGLHDHGIVSQPPTAIA